MVGVVGRAPRVVRNEEVLNSSFRRKLGSQKAKKAYRVKEESDSVVNLVVLKQRRMSSIVAFARRLIVLFPAQQDEGRTYRDRKYQH